MEYITLDRIKLKSHASNLLEWLVTPTDNKDPKTGYTTSRMYNSKNDPDMPLDLYIAVNEWQDKLTIEFTSRILLDDCWMLISKHTIRQCLESICKLGVCELDIDGILNDAAVTSIDVTKDIPFTFTDSLFHQLELLSGDYKRFKKQHYDKEGITFTRDVKEHRCKEEMTFYDKERELNALKNKYFIGKLQDPNELLRRFKGKMRIEASFPTAKKIRTVLGLEKSYLWDVLNCCEVNPLIDIFDRIFPSPPQLSRASTYDEFVIECVLSQYNGDVKAIEQKLKSIGVNDRTRYRKMQIYRAIQHKQEETSSQYQMVRQLKAMISDYV